VNNTQFFSCLAGSVWKPAGRGKFQRVEYLYDDCDEDYGRGLWEFGSLFVGGEGLGEKRYG